MRCPLPSQPYPRSIPRPPALDHRRAAVVAMAPPLRAASARVPAAQPGARAPPDPPGRNAPRPFAGLRHHRRERRAAAHAQRRPARFTPRRACALAAPLAPLLGRGPRAGSAREPLRCPAGRPMAAARAQARRRREQPGTRAEQGSSLPLPLSLFR